MFEWQALVLAAKDAGNSQNNPLLSRNWIPVNGQSLLSRSLESNSRGAMRKVVVLPGAENRLWFQSNLAADFDAVFLAQPTRGALCTAVLAMDKFDSNLPLAISSGDSFADWPASTAAELFLQGESHAGMVTLRSENEDLSYVRVANSGRVIEVAEKRRISEFATTGFFIFRKAGDFLEAAKWVLSSNMHTNGSFYLSSALNFAIMRGKEVSTLPLPSDRNYYRLNTLGFMENFQGGPL